LKSIKLLNGKGASTFPAINHDGKRIVMNRRQTFSIISFTVSPPLKRWMLIHITIVWGWHWDGSTSIANKFWSRHE